MPWRSNVAQAFVQGRIALIDGYWPPQQMVGEICDTLDRWDLWDDAFGGLASQVRGHWNRMLNRENFVQARFRQVASAFSNERRNDQRALGDYVDELAQGLQRMHDRAALTINFKAPAWFAAGPGFPTYRTMWELRQTNAAISAPGGDPKIIRAKADRWALYGQFPKPAPGAGGGPGGLQLPYVTAAPAGSATALQYSQRKGAPADSQVFAALNYGTRPHGANTYYGKSYFVLNASFKDHAIYVPMDSFTPMGVGRTKQERARIFQLSKGTFGSLILSLRRHYEDRPGAVNLLAMKSFAADVLRCARDMQPREDTDRMNLLIEAHIFRDVSMTPADVAGVCISRSEMAGVPQANIDTFKQTSGLTIRYID